MLTLHSVILARERSEVFLFFWRTRPSQPILAVQEVHIKLSCQFQFMCMLYKDSEKHNKVVSSTEELVLECTNASPVLQRIVASLN